MSFPVDAVLFEGLLTGLSLHQKNWIAVLQGTSVTWSKVQ